MVSCYLILHNSASLYFASLRTRRETKSASCSATLASFIYILAERIQHRLRVFGRRHCGASCLWRELSHPNGQPAHIHEKLTIGSSTALARIVAHPSAAGDVWTSFDTGLFHDTNYGGSFTAVTQPRVYTLGTHASTGGYTSVFAAADIGIIVDYFRSDNQGSTWICNNLNHSARGFGAAAATSVISGDPRKYCLSVDCVFVGGRGADEFESSV
jgi:hypothetical protein